MVTVDEVRSQISQAKQQAQKQRKILKQKEQEIKQVEDSLRAKEKKMPLLSQSRLRSGLYAGIEGRKRRRQVSSAKRELVKRKQEVGEYKKELSRFTKQELQPFELQISQREKELQKYEEHKKAIKIAQRVFFGEAPVFALSYNKLAKDYYRQMKSGQVVSNDLKNDTQISIKSIPEGKIKQEKITLKQRSMNKTDKIKDFTSKITGTIFSKKKIPQLGIPVMKFEERAKITGGFVSIKDPYVFPESSSVSKLSPMKIRNIPQSQSLSSKTIRLSSKIPSIKDLSPERTDKLIKTKRYDIKAKRLTNLTPRKNIKDRKLKTKKEHIFLRKEKLMPSIEKKKENGRLFLKKKIKKDKKRKFIWEF